MCLKSFYTNITTDLIFFKGMCWKWNVYEMWWNVENVEKCREKKIIISIFFPHPSVRQ